MSPPCNVPRLVRCRVRDFASCFYACRLPLEEETDNFCSKPPPQVSAAGRAHKVVRGEMSSPAENGGKSVVVQKGDRAGPAESGNGSEPHFAEEDYIVFCFREDGKIDMMNEGSNNNNNNNNNQHTDNIITATTLRPMINGNKKGDEKESKGAGDEIKEINSIEQPNNAKKMDSFESCDSNISDTSTSSFAFPE